MGHLLHVIKDFASHCQKLAEYISVVQDVQIMEARIVAEL